MFYFFQVQKKLEEYKLAKLEQSIFETIKVQLKSMPSVAESVSIVEILEDGNFK